MWLVYAFLAALSAASVAIFGKLGLKTIDSTVATTIRSIIMSGFLVIVSLALKKLQGFSLGEFSSREWLFIVAAGVSGALSWLFYFAALKTGLASRVVAIDRLSIVFVVVFGALFLGEALGWKVALGAALMVVGAVLISL
ncbi:EamA family transporter [Candidatus Parcubacteria bacterium]|nr:MAG: EamA family transporter [Candidatus Parcubacteria bacterium]